MEKNREKKNIKLIINNKSFHNYRHDDAQAVNGKVEGAVGEEQGVDVIALK